MADDLRNSRDLLDSEKERESLARSLARELGYQRETLDDILGIKRRINSFDKELVSLHQKVRDSASKLNSEYDTTKSIAKQLIQDEQTLVKLKRQEAFHLQNLVYSQKNYTDEINKEKDIVNNITSDVLKHIDYHKTLLEQKRAGAKVSADEISSTHRKIKALQSELITHKNIQARLETQQRGEKSTINLLAAKYKFLQKDSLEIQKIQDLEGVLSATEQARLVTLQSRMDKHQEEISRLSSSLSIEAQRALATKVAIQQQEVIIEERKKDQAILKNINESLGLTGAALGGLNKIASGLGMGHISDDLKDIQEKLNKDVANAVKRNGGAALDWGQKWKFMSQGVVASLKIIGKGLLDPLFILGKIFAAFLKVNAASTELRRITGQNAVDQSVMNSRMADSVDYLNTAVELTKQMGMNAQNIFTPDVIANAAELKNTMGLAADEVGSLSMMAQSSGKSLDSVVETAVASTSAFNKANRSAVSQGIVLRDIAKTSDHIKASLSNNPKALAEAASMARRLGMDLDRVDKIADSLMDFETSIQNQLEAQLLTGKNIDLAKARELALNNDLAGLGKELFKNSADILEYGKMNRIQQEAYAKSLGMSKDELARIAYNRALEAGMTEKQAAAAAKVTAEDMQRMNVQESLQKSLDKLAQAFAPLLQILEPIVDGISLILRLMASFVGMITGSTGGKVIAWAIALGFAIKGIWGNLGGLFAAFKNLGSPLDLLKDKMAGLKDFVMGPAKDKVKETAESVVGKSMDKVAGATEKAEKLKPSVGSGIKSFFINLGEGLKAFGEAMALGGAVGLAAFTLAAMGLGAALHWAAPGIKAFGTVIAEIGKIIIGALKEVPSIIGAVADGFVKIMGAVTLGNVGGLLLLGPALVSASVGMLAFSAALAAASVGNSITKLFTGEGILKPLKELTAMADSLSSVSSSLTSIASAIMVLSASLADLNIEKIKALADTKFGSLQGVSTTSITPIQTKPLEMAEGGIATSQVNNVTVGEAGKEAIVPLTEFYAKMDELISIVKKGGNVYLDGNKVGYNLMLGSTKLS